MNAKQILIVLGLVVLLGFVIYIPKLIQAFSVPPIENTVKLDCKLNNNECRYFSPHFGNITFSITPKELPAFKPLTLSVTVDNKDLKNVSISLEGKDMYMGPNELSLHEIQPGFWRGVGVIPVCSVDSSMIWLIVLTLQGTETERLVFEASSSH